MTPTNISDTEAPYVTLREASAPAVDSEGLMKKLEEEAIHLTEVLSDGLSDLKFIRQSQDLARPPANLAFKDVSFSYKEQVILERSSGCFAAGEVVAIMGPSGCGKTTLLDILAGKKTGHVQGQVLMNGCERDHMFQRVTAYVDQEDHMPEHWTVREAIDFNLALKYRTLSLKGMPQNLKHLYCDVILKAFGLYEHAHVYIGGPSVRGCSGGQKRRVTLARGIAQRVSIVFADEPTSGLSATDAVLCMRSLRVVAKRFGVLMLVVIHQPRQEVMKLFDHLLMLTANPGRVVYNNKIEEADRYFMQFKYRLPEHTNPTDFYLDLATPGAPKDQVEALVSAFKSQEELKVEKRVEQMLSSKGDTPQKMLLKSKSAISNLGHGREVKMRSNSIYAESFCVQLMYLLLRKIRITRRNPMTIAVTVGLPIGMAIVLGIMFEDIGDKPFDEQMPFIFMQTTNLGVAGMQLISTLVQERSIMKNESDKGLYSEFAWAASQFLVDVPLCLIGGMLNIVILYYFGYKEFSEKWLVMLKWCLLLFFVFTSLFSLLAAVAKDSRTACAWANCFNMIFASCSGFMLNKKNCPSYMRWIFKISPNAYAMQSIVIGLAPDCVNITAYCDVINKTQQCETMNRFKMLPSDSGQDCYHWNDLLTAKYGFEMHAEETGLLLMLGIVLLCRIGEVLALKYLNKVSK